MTDRARIGIAAAVTALFLGGASAAGVATHQPTAAAPPSPSAVVAGRPAAASPAPAARHDEGFDGQAEHESEAFDD